MGHSMGGLVVLAYALDGCKVAGLAGVIASGIYIQTEGSLTNVAPAFSPGTPIPRLKLILGRMFGRIMPRMAVSNGLDLSNMSRIPDVKEEFLADKKCSQKISLQTGTFFCKREN
jgi:alpha-beta hydrolase superfamily lysophospholipase